MIENIYKQNNEKESELGLRTERISFSKEENKQDNYEKLGEIQMSSHSSEDNVQFAGKKSSSKSMNSPLESQASPQLEFKQNSSQNGSKNENVSDSEHGIVSENTEEIGNSDSSLKLEEEKKDKLKSLDKENIVELEVQKGKNERFQRELNYIYKKIDKISSLLWAHGTYVQGKLRDKQLDKQNDSWKEKTKAQIGYGEVTKVTESSCGLNTILGSSHLFIHCLSEFGQFY
jgi:hypothetical protein